MRCQKIHICCVDKANIWWDDKKWFYQEMWKEIYLMCQQNICRDHKDICCVNTQQRMGNRHQLDVSLVWWRHDHCTKICKIPKISNVSLHKSPKSSRSPFLSLGSSFCGLKTRISLHLFSGCSNTFFPSIGHSNKVWETFTRTQLGGNFWFGRSRRYSFVCLYNSSVIDNIDNKLMSQNLVS